MRTRLLDATVDCLVELGYAGTTTTEVARRAGVSRGAQVHHFPTKQDLVVGAIAHVQARRQEEFRTTFGALAPEERTLGNALDLLWSIFNGPSFAAWLELAVATRSDPELRAHFLELNHRFVERTAELFAEAFPGASDPVSSANGVSFAFAVLNGLALQRHVGIGEDAETLFEMLKGLATMFAEQIGGSP